MLRRARRKPISNINAVPYIDVMLVLLVIFMISTPLMTQGVSVDLPQASSEPVEIQDKEPLVVTVDIDGAYYLSIGDNIEEPINHDLLVQRVAAVMRYQPGTPVLVRGDKDVNYGSVMVAMALIQKAGAPSIGLLTELPSDD